MKGIPPIRKASLTANKVSKIIANLASDKKALDIVVLDMRRVANFCDYFVICGGNTNRQVRAIADHIEEGLGELGIRLSFKQGFKQSDWIVFDAGDVVTHIFEKDLRDFYRLEYLWQEAKRVKWEN